MREERDAQASCVRATEERFMRPTHRRIVLASLVLVALASCSAPPPEPRIETTPISGALVLAPGSTLAHSDLQVTTLAATATVEADGSYTVHTTVADGPQLHFFDSVATGNTIYIGLHDAATGTIQAGTQSTALALLLANPLLLTTPKDRIADLADAAPRTASFGLLIDELAAAYRRDAEAALNLDANPRVFQLALEALVETIQYLEAEAAITGARSERVAPTWLNIAPFIEDGPSGNVVVVNPRHVFYGAGVHPQGVGAGASATVLIDRKEQVIQGLDWQWAWPPVSIVSDPAETSLNLGDGYFRIELVKYDARLLVSPRVMLDAIEDDPAALATLHNTTSVLVYLLELLIYDLPIYDQRLLSWPRYVGVAAGDARDLTIAIANTDVVMFLETFASIIEDNIDELAYWIWQDTQETAAVSFLQQGGQLLKNLLLVLKVYDYGNEEILFIWDLVFAPSAEYFVTQQNGTIVSFDENLPPSPRFTVSPMAGVVGTEFTFDATPTTDDHDTSELRFRWDFDGDGAWDTDWNAQRTARHTFDSEGSYSVILKVRDRAGLLAVAVQKVNVGGSGGHASRVLLFRDNLPWDSNATVTVLESLGFTEGVGPNTYRLVGSEEMHTVPLNPQEDLVFISNDQVQAFYDRYAASRVRFANFVLQGGTMFWGASDMGWAEGSMQLAGVDLPGNVVTTFGLSTWNYVVDSSLPLVAGLPLSMDHNYASHERFSSLPSGSTIYLVDEESQPTLIEYSFGAGWVIASGLPLEHQYERVYGAYDLEQLLPRIVSYVTDTVMPATATSGTSPLEERPLPHGVAPTRR
jgi:hypothetical protein